MQQAPHSRQQLVQGGQAVAGAAGAEGRGGEEQARSPRSAPSSSSITWLVVLLLVSAVWRRSNASPSHKCGSARAPQPVQWACCQRCWDECAGLWGWAGRRVHDSRPESSVHAATQARCSQPVQPSVQQCSQLPAHMLLLLQHWCRPRHAPRGRRQRPPARAPAGRQVRCCLHPDRTAAPQAR